MRWSRTANYALLALGYIAEHGEGRSVLAKHISEHYSIPMDYLLKVLHLLVRGGVLRSVRGPSGGYRLSRPAEQVTFAEVIELISGASSENEGPGVAGKEGVPSRRIRHVFEAGEEAARQVYRQKTLANLIKE
jgi:Rrf2 family protein